MVVELRAVRDWVTGYVRCRGEPNSCSEFGFVTLSLGKYALTHSEDVDRSVVIRTAHAVVLASQ